MPRNATFAQDANLCDVGHSSERSEHKYIAERLSHASMASIVEFQVTIPSDTGEAQAVQERIIEAMEKYEYSPRDLFSVRLALEEALTNSIKHGNGMDPARTVAIECEITPDRMHVAIEDEGDGFNPDDVPDPTAEENLERPCGRGLMLIRTYMSQVRFNDRGNRVILEKERSRPDRD